jgi:uncharacterized membrane protein YdjX (TVP38/TMEM64 family)
LRKTLIALLTLAIIVAIWWLADLRPNELIPLIRRSHEDFALHYGQHPLAVVCGFFCAFTLLAALAFPGASILMLLAGANFGLFWGTALSLLASTTGATLSMLVTRHFFRPRAEKRYGQKLAGINARIERVGSLYLFGLRMAPVIPYAILNPLFGLSRIKTSTFFAASAAGMLAGTAAYVNAGRSLAGIENAADILSPDIIGALALLGVLPLLSKKLFNMQRRQTASNPAN